MYERARRAVNPQFSLTHAPRDLFREDILGPREVLAELKALLSIPPLDCGDRRRDPRSAGRMLPLLGRQDPRLRLRLLRLLRV